MAQTVGKYMCVALFVLVTVALGQVVAQSEGAAVWAPTWADTLKKDLLKGYDPSIRPSQHYNVTTVETGITITHVEINEIKSTLSVYGWMKFKWYDARLAWEPQLNGNVTQLFLNQSAIWQPTLDEKGPLVKVTSNGLLEYTNALQQQSKCTIQWQRWPFDTQQCRMLFSPWAEVDGMEIHVKMLKYEIAQGTMWTVMNMTLETHTAIDVHETPVHRGTHLVVELKRNSGIYRSTITAPACVLILMNLLSFWLPPNCGEKLILNAINVLITCMFLIHFNEYLSYYTTSTPTVVLFFGQSLYLSGFCLLMTVVLECVVKSNSKKPLHPALKKLITFELIAMIISTNKTDEKCLGDEMCETLQDEQEVEEALSSTRQRPTDTPQQDWLLFVTLLERIVFALYVIILSLMLALYF
ncbi:neuronal acetylcholine receptor subunit eat-2-like isoform X1 [Anopheles arabiensis]|uniref:Neurotransmitter-gated ion-channel ligand-binding domain-containing protein n=1 Tax=Anopheles arabiensis TaxID=7173 RepID=A0A8W7MGX6_ANOAR|nr:neuronal acetylcholine receptor subunit eat-2-like isoform X1 [Anopheles arabiensis]